MAMIASSMRDRIKAKIASVGAYQGPGGSETLDYRDQVLEALCAGIIEEIVANSELVPDTTDHGAAGAGIITGSVK